MNLKFTRITEKTLLVGLLNKDLLLTHAAISVVFNPPKIHHRV